MFLRFTYIKNRRSQIIVGHMPSAILKITITSQSVIMNTIQNATDANFSQHYSVKSSQLLAVLTVALKNETRWSISQSIQSIQAWKAHLLRAVNQDAARHEILENLDPQAVLVVMDWAMKFLPRKF